MPTVSTDLSLLNRIIVISLTFLAVTTLFLGIGNMDYELGLVHPKSASDRSRDEELKYRPPCRPPHSPYKLVMSDGGHWPVYGEDIPDNLEEPPPQKIRYDQEEKERNRVSYENSDSGFSANEGDNIANSSRKRRAAAEKDGKKPIVAASVDVINDDNNQRLQKPATENSKPKLKPRSKPKSSKPGSKPKLSKPGSKPKSKPGSKPKRKPPVPKTDVYRRLKRWMNQNMMKKYDDNEFEANLKDSVMADAYEIVRLRQTDSNRTKGDDNKENNKQDRKSPAEAQRRGPSFATFSQKQSAADPNSNRAQFVNENGQFTIPTDDRSSEPALKRQRRQLEQSQKFPFEDLKKKLSYEASRDEAQWTGHDELMDDLTPFQETTNYLNYTKTFILPEEKRYVSDAGFIWALKYGNCRETDDRCDGALAISIAFFCAMVHSVLAYFLLRNAIERMREGRKRKAALQTGKHRSIQSVALNSSLGVKRAAEKREELAADEPTQNTILTLHFAMIFSLLSACLALMYGYRFMVVSWKFAGYLLLICFLVWIYDFATVFEFMVMDERQWAWMLTNGYVLGPDGLWTKKKRLRQKYGLTPDGRYVGKKRRSKRHRQGRSSVDHGGVYGFGQSTLPRTSKKQRRTNRLRCRDTQSQKERFSVFGQKADEEILAETGDDEKVKEGSKWMNAPQPIIVQEPAAAPHNPEYGYYPRGDPADPNYKCDKWGRTPEDEDFAQEPYEKDEEGKPIYEKNGDGNPIYKTDADGKVLYGLDGDDNICYGRNKKGRPVYGRNVRGDSVYGRDTVGNIVYAYDDQGKVVYGRNKRQRLVYGTDEFGNDVYGVDKDGQIHFIVDEDGKGAVRYGRNHNGAILYPADSDGNVVYAKDKAGKEVLGKAKNGKVVKPGPTNLSKGRDKQGNVVVRAGPGFFYGKGDKAHVSPYAAAGHGLRDYDSKSFNLEYGGPGAGPAGEDRNQNQKASGEGEGGEEPVEAMDSRPQTGGRSALLHSLRSQGSIKQSPPGN